MAKEVKKGVATTSKKPTTTRKAAASTKKAAASTKKAAPKRVAKKVETKSNVTSVVYMFLLTLGVALVFVSLTLKFTRDIDNSTMLYCLGIALASLIISSFVKRMNETVKKLGLNVTHFVEPSGYDEHNITTAKEFVAFARTSLVSKLFPCLTLLSTGKNQTP